MTAGQTTALVWHRVCDGCDIITQVSVTDDAGPVPIPAPAVVPCTFCKAPGGHWTPGAHPHTPDLDE